MKDESSRPEIKNDLSKVENSDTIYIGYPIWWGTAPRIIQTFFESYDLRGKTVYLFCTSGGSGIESLLEVAEIKPMVNQILCHISNTPEEFIEFCKKKDIAVEAYSPIAHGEILNQPGIKHMADKYGVSVAQLCIRYTLQLGTISLPKTGNPEHMKTNGNVDFETSKEDMEILENFKKIESYGASSGFPVYGGRL